MTLAALQKVEIELIVELHCVCGNSVTLKSDSPAGLIVLISSWLRSHHGRGHRRCSAEQARLAREKFDEDRCEVDE